MKIIKNIFKWDINLPEPLALSRIFAVTSIIIIVTGFALFSLNECPDHEGQELEQAKTA